MNDLKLEDHYKVELNTLKGLFNYSTCRTENYPLFGHQVLPQGYVYIKPSLSPDCKYISIIGKSEIDDKIFIWSMDNLDSYLYSYTSKSIENLIFSPDSKYFYILYKSEPPIKYEIKTGKEILSFDFPQEEITQMICHSFSKDGKNLIIGTKNFFISWNVTNGKIVKFIKDDGIIKYIKNDVLFSVKDNMEFVKYNKSDAIEKKFALPNIEKIDDILSFVISSDLNYIYYADKNGINKYNINKNDNKIEQIMEFNKENQPTKVEIDDNCKFAMTTDMLTINIYELKNLDNYQSIPSEQFSDLCINFQKKKALLVDDICINIVDTTGKELQKYIWLNENPSKFLYFTFSPDNQVILGIIDENNAIAYNTSTGRVIKKWRNMEDDWSMACEIAPETSQVAIIATKSNDNMVKIWNYNNGSELISLYGHNAHSFCFSPDGNLLLSGAREGEEIARLWDLVNGTCYSFIYQGKNNNLYTIVNLTEDLQKIIAASIGQEPVVFDYQTQQLLYKCECPINFEKIKSIQSNIKYNCFIVKGRDTNHKDMAILYKLDDGKILQIFENCGNIQLSKNEGIIISKSSNINEGNLTLSDITNLDKIEHKNCQIQADNSSILQDDKSIVSAFGDEKNLTFIMNETKNGKVMAEIKFTQNYDRHGEVDLYANGQDKILTLRYIEFIEPLEV